MLEIILIISFWMIVWYTLGRLGLGAKKAETLTLSLISPSIIRKKLIALAHEKGWGLMKEDQLQNGFLIKLQAGQYGWSRQGAQYITIQALTSPDTTISIFIESQLVMSQLIDYSNANTNNIKLIKDALFSPITGSTDATQLSEFPQKKVLFAKNFIILLGCLGVLSLAFIMFVVLTYFNNLKELRTLHNETSEKLNEFNLEEQKRLDEMRKQLKISSTPNLTRTPSSSTNIKIHPYRLDFIFIRNLPQEEKLNLLTKVFTLKNCIDQSITYSTCFVTTEKEQNEIAMRSLNYSWVTQLLVYEKPFQNINQSTLTIHSNVTSPTPTPPVNRLMYQYRADILFNNSLTSTDSETILNDLSLKQCYLYIGIYSCYFKTGNEYLMQIEKISKREDVDQIIRYIK